MRGPCEMSSFPLVGYSLSLASCSILSSSFFCFLTIVFFQSLIARSREKSQFLCEHKEDWDRLVDEAQLHRDMTT